MDSVPVFNYVPPVDMNVRDYGTQSLFSPSVDEKSPLEDRLTPRKEKDWTVLSYVMDNNLGKMRQMESVGTSDRTNIVSSFARQGGVGMERSYYLVNHSNSESYMAEDNSVALKNMGIQDFGDPKTLEDFLVWGIKNFPAKNYAIVMHNHGNIWMGGWRDFSTENMLTLPEIQKSLDNVYKRTGVRPNIIAMDACLMANIENAYQLRDTADYLVASEDLEFMQYHGEYAGMALDKMLDLLPREKEDVCLQPADVAERWIEQSETNKGTPTLSALKLKEIRNVARKADTLAGAILDSGVSMEVIRQIVMSTKHFAERGETKPFIYQHDLYHFAQNILAETSIQDEAVRSAAKALCTAIDRAVMRNQNKGPGEENAHGISVYLPHRIEGVERPQQLLEQSVAGKIRKHISYQDLAFARDSRWDELFTKIAAADTEVDTSTPGNAIYQATSLITSPISRGIQYMTSMFKSAAVASPISNPNVHFLP